jgi:hypothetical protein
MSIPKVMDALSIGKCYHLYYKDNNKLVIRDRHALVFVLDAGNGKKHLCAFTVEDFERYVCEDFKLDPKATVIVEGFDSELTSALTRGQVARTEREYGKGLRVSKFFTLEVDGKLVNIQIPGSAYGRCMQRVDNILDDLIACLRVGKECVDTRSKLIGFDNEDKEANTKTYIRHHGCACGFPCSFITWEGEDYKALMDKEIDTFEALPNPLNVGEHREPAKIVPKEKIGWFKRWFGWMF